MSNQEFSSPGEHMASMSGGSSRVVDAGPSNGSGPGESNIIYSPGALDNINRGYVLHRDEYDSSSSRDIDNTYVYKNNDYNDLLKVIEKFNDKYFEKNAELFNSAKEYDMMMSNTAIQRQMADLKAAGLNPILAANYMGATYHGVQAPYLSISPASALGNMLNYESSMYATDVNAKTQIETTNLYNASNEFVAQFNKVYDLYMQGAEHVHENDIVELQKNANRYLDAMKALDNQEIQKLGFENNRVLYDYQNELNKDFYNLKFSKENFSDFWVKLGNAITGISPLAAVSQVQLPNFSTPNPVGFKP